MRRAPSSPCSGRAVSSSASAAPNTTLSHHQLRGGSARSERQSFFVIRLRVNYAWLILTPAEAPPRPHKPRNARAGREIRDRRPPRHLQSEAELAGMSISSSPRRPAHRAGSRSSPHAPTPSTLRPGANSTAHAPQPCRAYGLPRNGCQTPRAASAPATSEPPILSSRHAHTRSPDRAPLCEYHTLSPPRGFS